MKKYLILTLGLLALLSACSSGTPAATRAPGIPTAAAPTLDGTGWTVSHIDATATLEDQEPSIRFAAGKVSGSATCNQFAGGYTQDGAALTFTQAATTQLMCADDVWMAQEAAFLTALANVTAVRAADSVVELLDADQQIALTLYPAKDQQLEGTTWRLSGIIADEAVTSPASDSLVTITIEGGRLTGKACNRFSGPVEVNGESFRAGPLKSTRMACKTKALSAQESTVLKTLEAVTTVSIEGSELTLATDDGAGLQFTAAE